MITEGQVMDIARDTLFLIIKVSAPLLLISLVIGLYQYFSNSYFYSGADINVCT